jgi:molybdate transport system substrate-binding protein
VTRRVVGVAALLLCSTVAGCGSDGARSEESGTLTVYAAASLSSSFEEIGQQFEAHHEGVEVKFSFGGSSDLVAQIQQGAPADVLASADTKNMDKATADDLVEGKPVDFASNTLEIAVPPDNPADVASLEDLGKPETKVVVCAAKVPCGAAAQGVEDASGVAIEPVSEEQSVTDVLNKVTSGEADAGLVYVTDVKAAGDKVKGISFAESSEVVNTYPIVALADSKNQDLAQEFVDLVTGAAGQKVLADAGFARP